MENRLKERLTGAAILVALIVLLVPEMFRGRRSEAPSANASNTDGPPMRSYTIDLTNNANSAPPQSTPGPAPVLPAAPASSVATAAAPVASPPPLVQAAPAAAGAPAPTSAIAAAAGPEPAAATVNAASRSSVSAATAARRANIAPTSKGGWMVQLGIFAQRGNAERLARSAQQKGFNVSVSRADGRGFYHVHTPSLSDRAGAQTLQRRLKTEGFAAAVTAAQ